jgi:lysophospholipase L1-like esterase
MVVAECIRFGGTAVFDSVLTSGLARRRRFGGRFLVVLTVSLALAVAGSARPPVAAAASGSCSAHATTFAEPPIDGGSAALRMGCARDAGGLRSLATSDDDLVVAVDFNPGQDQDQLRQNVQGLVDATRADQAKGLSLGQSLTQRADRDRVGLTPRQTDPADYNGSINLVGNSLVVVVRASDVGAEGFWAKLVGGAIGLGIGILATLGCVRFFGAAGEWVPVACGVVGGAIGGFFGELIEAAIDGENVFDPEVLKNALANAIVGAIGGVFGGKYGGQMARWSADRIRTVVRKAKLILRTAAEVLGSWGAPLKRLADLLDENWADGLLDRINRYLRGANGSSVQLRIMPLGDSITFGMGSSDGSGYRSRLYSELNDQNDVTFVGSQHSGPAPDANEGHPGWLISDIAGIADSVLAAYKPNVVLLHIGTNDMGRNVDPAGAPARLGSLIDQIFRDDPGVTLLVSTLVPSSFPGTAERIATFNEAIPGMVASRQSAGRDIRLVTMWAVSGADLADGLHPNDLGYQKMAAAFFRGVVTALDAGVISPPTPGASSGGDPVKGWFPQGVIASGTLSPGSYPGTLNLTGADKVQFADVDGGGKLAFIANHEDGSMNVWTNGGVGSDGTVNWISHGNPVGALNYIHHAVWQLVDLRGHGRDDLVEIDPATHVVIDYVNPGTPGDGRLDWQYWATITPPGFADPAGQVRFADINGDGRADFLDVAPNSSVRAWTNDGTDSQGHQKWGPPSTIADGVGDPGGQIQFADLNGDGKADYLDVAPNSSVKAWLSGGPNPNGGYYWFPQGVIASGVGDSGSQIQFADINHNGKADYLDVNPANGSTKQWKNGGPGSGGDWLWFPQGTITAGNVARIVYADLNGDHKADYLQVNADSSVKAWLNGGPNSSGGDWLWFPQGTIASGVGAPGSTVRFADLNGDGKADYLVVNANGSVQAWLNGGPNSSGGDWLWFPQGTIASGVGDPGGQIQFADLNGDGKADYLDVAPNSSVKAWLNGGPNSSGGDWLWFPQGTIASGVGAPGSQIHFAPLYGTSRADYLVVADNSAVQVWQNGGPKPNGGDWLWFPGGQVASGVGDPGSQIQFADLNGDGRADYLDVNPTTGATKAWLNAG